MISITLNIDKTINYVADFDYGHDKYVEIKDKIQDNTEHYIIEFPNYVTDIAISFVQGFTYEIIDEIGLDEFYDRFEISGNETLVTNFYKSLKY